MSWQASAWAMEKGKAYELEPVTRFVLLTLANYADKEGNDIYPSLRTLEGDTGLSERTIRRHIKHLIACRLMEYGDQSVVTDNPRYRNDKLPKVYRLIFERPGQERGVDFGNFGADPDGVKSKPRKAEPAPEERPDTESGGTQSPERPDTESGTTGQTGGHRVHQTYNPPIDPLEDPVPVTLTAEQIEAGRILRQKIAARNAERRAKVQRQPKTGEIPA